MPNILAGGVFVAITCLFCTLGLCLSKLKIMIVDRLPVFYRNRIWWHVLFWVATFVVYWLTFAGYQDRYYQEFVMNLLLLPARMIGTYSLIYLILPLATNKKKFFIFSLLILVHAVLYGFLIRLTFYFANPFPDFYHFSDQLLFDLPKILATTISNYGIPAMAAAIIIFKKWYYDTLLNQKLAEEKLAAELNFLKSQIHPHFLFNTLNNLYALTLINSEKTSDVVLKLSDLLDYMIYRSNAEFVPLSKELEITEGYIELEKMRYNERLDLRYEIIGETGDREIAPLVLLPFIENCFKHGASNDRSRPSIHIRLEILEDMLCFTAVNSISSEHINAESEGEGIGLANVRRRLELIYPNRHEIKLRSADGQFTAVLKLFHNK